MAGGENTLVRFDGADGARLSCLVDNHTDLQTPMADLESGEPIKFLFALLTQRNADGDLKLAKVQMCWPPAWVRVRHRGCLTGVGPP